jgi:copper(I)-binding protein
MRKFRQLFLALLLSPTLALAAQSPSLRIEQAYSYATPAPGITAGGFLTIVNAGAADRLLGAESPAVGRVEIHEMSLAGGVMRMRALSEGLAVPAQGRLQLAPGGYHLMLIEPKQALALGAKLPLVLHFEKAGRVEVELEVRSRDADAHSHAGH